MADTNRYSITMLAVWISLISNLILTGLKIVVGFLFNSQVLIADGVHNTGDVIVTMDALGSAMVAKKPADIEHPWTSKIRLLEQLIGSGSSFGM